VGRTASARDVPKSRRVQRMWAAALRQVRLFQHAHRSGGGLEHRNSTWLNASRWHMQASIRPSGRRDRRPPRSPPSRNSWLGSSATSHPPLERERFVSGTRTFDFENEVYTRSLWHAKASPRTTARSPSHARLTNQSQLLGACPAPSATPERAGRLVQPVETASFDA